MIVKRLIFLGFLGLLLVAVITVNLQSPRTKSSVLLPSANTIALINIEGAISGGSGSWADSGADTILEMVDRVGSQPGVKALVIRINSPGGTVAASQELYTEIERLRSAGLPVVVSMGDTAASGGYMIAMAADYIFANPGTITGSIGVIMEIMNFQELMDKLGIDFETFVSGQYKDMGSSSRSITDDERAMIQGMVDEIHQQFVEVVAQGRNMPVEEVLPLAQGQIFTGSQALEVGLVDELGTLNDAVAKAAEMAGLDTYVVEDFSYFNFWDIFGFGLDSGLLGSWMERLLQRPGYGSEVPR